MHNVLTLCKRRRQFFSYKLPIGSGIVRDAQFSEKEVVMVSTFGSTA